MLQLQDNVSLIVVRCHVSSRQCPVLNYCTRDERGGMITHISFDALQEPLFCRGRIGDGFLGSERLKNTKRKIVQTT